MPIRWCRASCATTLALTTARRCPRFVSLPSRQPPVARAHDVTLIFQAEDPEGEGEDDETEENSRAIATQANKADMRHNIFSIYWNGRLVAGQMLRE